MTSKRDLLTWRKIVLLPIVILDKNVVGYIVRGARWISEKKLGETIVDKMGEGWRILLLLLQKNFIVRKRHWIGTIAEIIAPGCIFAIIMGLRTLIPPETTTVNSSTIYDSVNRTSLTTNSTLLRVLYLPQNDFTKKIMGNAVDCLGISSDQLYGFDTEAAMVSSYETLQTADLTISVLAVVFNGTAADIVPTNLVYTIKSSFRIKTTLVSPDYGGPSADADALINSIPFVSLQMCIDDSYISEISSDYNAEKAALRTIQKMPYPPYETADFSELFFRDTIGNWVPIMFIVTLFMLPSFITTEKETGVIALLKMNGVKAHINFLSWIISGMVLGTVANAISVIVLKVYFSPVQLPFYYYSNGFILWLTLYINFINVYAFCLHVASYFNHVRLSQGATVLLVYAVMQIVNQLGKNELYRSLPYLGFLFPTAAAVRMLEEFNDQDNLQIGVHWRNIFTTNHEVLGFDGTLGFIMLFSILSTVFHFLVALYLEAVLPGKYGVQKSPLFFLQFLKKNKVSTSIDSTKTEALDGQPKILEHVANGALKPGIQIRDLAKTFTVGVFRPRTVEAVRGISVDFYKGQITALLGHNGAGKTTTISILTGLTAPTSGAVSINGKDVSKDMQEIRDDLGLCPQENMLFSDLTVGEQLQLFGLLKQKNKPRQQVIQDVDDLLVKLRISEKRDILPHNLSGGQKRRVCLGMSLIGDASTLILDEPTSGMDPETSRVTWEIILKYRKQKTIIITTHSMEEADVLGDRIAIMDSGKMRCYGTSMFLKKFYGKDCQEVTLSTELWCDPGKIQTIVGSQAKMDTSTYGRIVLSIPMTDHLPHILDKIELMKAELGITGVSVSTITLEEVFLKAAEDPEETDETVEPEDQDEIVIEKIKVPEGSAKEKNSDIRRLDRVTGSQLTKQIFLALMAKKASYALNHWGVSSAIIFGTLLAVVLMPIFAINRADTANLRPLDLSLYPNSEALIYAENETLSTMYKEVVESQGGTGTVVGTDVSIIDALLERAEEGIVYYRNNIIISGEFATTDDQVTANALYSGSARLSAPITVNVMSNSLLKAFAGDQYSISASIENLPRSFIDYIYDEFSIKSENLLQMMLFISVFFIIVGLFVINPLLETTTAIKQLQRMTGVSSVLYWGTMFLFDYAVYIVATMVTVIGFVIMDKIFDAKTYYPTEVAIIMLLLLLFGINLLLEVYILSFYKKPLYIILLILCLANMIIAQLQVFVDLALQYMDVDRMGFTIQRRIFSLLPHVSFTFGFSKFLEVASNNARCRKLPNSYSHLTCFSIVLKDPCCGLGCVDGSCTSSIPYFGDFSKEAGFEEYILYLALMPFGLVGIIYLLDSRVIGKLMAKLCLRPPKASGSNGVVDSFVMDEKNIIRQGINQREADPRFNDENVFFAYELSKRYGNFEAVKEVNFRVMKNECFGLLGVNGAGKSTTFRMLIGEDFPTSGILLRGHNNIKHHRKEYLAEIGYCPQINALIPSFNAYQHLSLFARLRGVPDSEVGREVDFWIDVLRLNKHAPNASQNYSGGNKRRLNIAMALIANPEMVLLDEPTAGVDPGARRSLWGVLQKCQASGQAIILTSHSMEECEALCNRLLIMVRGQLVCVGASQQLKQRFGAGYDITVKLNPERTEQENMGIKDQIQAAFDCELRDEHPGYLLYHIIDSQTTWVKMFGIMNDLKSKYSCLEDFTVSSATLEQLFIQFAKSAPGSLLATTTSASNGVANNLIHT